ncbi:hypothetical protein HYW21_01570 [Candidatus Woesearchaeota archaeon]|nr:hypothetical protein [Candidatus Woesearchaeota archaeon]
MIKHYRREALAAATLVGAVAFAIYHNRPVTVEERVMVQPVGDRIGLELILPDHRDGQRLSGYTNLVIEYFTNDGVGDKLSVGLGPFVAGHDTLGLQVVDQNQKPGNNLFDGRVNDLFDGMVNDTYLHRLSHNGSHWVDIGILAQSHRDGPVSDELTLVGQNLLDLGYETLLNRKGIEVNIQK